MNTRTFEEIHNQIMGLSSKKIHENALKRKSGCSNFTDIDIQIHTFTGKMSFENYIFRDNVEEAACAMTSLWLILTKKQKEKEDFNLFDL